MPQTIIDYHFESSPDPLEISSSSSPIGHTTQGLLTFEIDKSENILCKEIVISVPIGNLEQEVFFDDPSPSIVLSEYSNWSASSATLHKFDGSNLAYLSFTIVNNTNNFAILSPLKITITGIVNHLEGSSDILLSELSTTVKANNFQVRKKSFSVNKSNPPSFYLRNFIASDVGDPTQILSFFKYKKPFVLNWESNGESYELLQSGISDPIYSGTETTFTITAGINTPMTFIVRATKGSDLLYTTTTVFVDTPDILANNLSVNWVTDLNYHINSPVLTTMGQAIVNTDLNVNGTTTMAGINGATVFNESIDITPAKAQVFSPMVSFLTINPVGLGINHIKFVTPSDGYLFISFENETFKRPLTLELNLDNAVLFTSIEKSNYFIFPISKGNTVQCITQFFVGYQLVYNWMAIGKSVPIKAQKVELSQAQIKKLNIKFGNLSA